MIQETVSKIVEKHKNLIRHEQAEEHEFQTEYLQKYTKSQLKSKGIALFNLGIDEQKSTLAGRTIIQLSSNGEPKFPAHNIRVGDIVQVSPSKQAVASTNGPESCTAVVVRVKEDSISVSGDDFETVKALSNSLKLIKIANDITFKRIRIALDTLDRRAKDSDSDWLLELLFEKEPKVWPINPVETKSWNYPHLNPSQREAVNHALGAEKFMMIHGPPGTGKTETIAEIIRQVSHIGNTKILICGPSNLSVDNIIERLGVGRRDLVRLGHPARAIEQVQEYCLDTVLYNGDSSALVKDIKAEIETSLKKMSKCKGSEKRALYTELKNLRKEQKERELKSIENLFNERKIVACTLAMAGCKYLKDAQFEVLIIDEACQALEAECWIAMNLLSPTGKVILAGDHKQLPPTITSKKAESGGLGISLFERYFERLPALCKTLRIQYRMNDVIMQWANQELYNGVLISDQSVFDHLLADENPDFDGDALLDCPMVFCDTAGFEFDEEREDDKSSFFNSGEANLAVDQLKRLVASGVEAEDIAIITPYSAQVAHITACLPENVSVEIGTVDGFQGREKEAIIISLVRSNDACEIGFLSEHRRTNVAITRARKHVYIIGDSQCLGRDPFYQRLISYVEERGEVTYPVS